MATATFVEHLTKRDRRVLTIEGSGTVADAALRMRNHHVGCMIVTNEEGELVGILSERDIIAKVIAGAHNPAETSVESVMTRQVVACGMDTPISRAQSLMAQYEIRHLPIIEGKIPVGMISSRDILAHQLSTVRAIVRQQSKFIMELERENPGITSIKRDRMGRVVI